MTSTRGLADDASARLFDAIAARSGGVTADELAAALGAAAADVSGWVEELQLDGTVYERGGRFYVL